MSATEHLQVGIDEYDVRIRTFIPNYEELIGTAADALRLLDVSAPTIVDLGIGTGALAAECLGVPEAAHLVGIDADAEMLEAARARLAGHAQHGQVRFIRSDFLDAALPPCDALVASLALHHIPTKDAKQAFYASCRDALRPGGLLVSADYLPAREPRLAASQRDAWLTHLRQTYPLDECERYFTAWSGEDVYVPLEDELQWLRGAGLEPEVVWRKGGFAVVVGRGPV